MRYGIPDYRLPQEILQAEINWILAHGVEARTETALGKDVTLEQLRDEHDAVVLAMGCWRSSPLRCPGEELPGVLGGIDFLYSVNTGKPVQVGKRVAVVGGGNTAMDASRCAKRSGADKVYVVYRRTRDEMPAEETEIAEAMEEGVEFLFLAAPTAVEGAGKVERLLCERMILGEPDASGRRRPVPTGDTFTLEVDTVIAAIGQAPDLASLPKNIHDGRVSLQRGLRPPLLESSSAATCSTVQTSPSPPSATATGRRNRCTPLYHWQGKTTLRIRRGQNGSDDGGFRPRDKSTQGTRPS
jgi:formate dehydrogenase major subunit